MFTRKSRFIALLVLVVMLVQMLASCTVEVGQRPEAQPLDRDPYASLDKYEYQIGNTSLVFNYSPEEEAELLKNIKRAKRLLESGSSCNSFLAVYTTIDEQFSRLTSQAQIAYIEYCMMAKNQEVIDNYLHINELRTDIVQDLIQMYRTIYDSPYRDAFYEGWSEEEIRYALDQADLYTDEFKALNNRADELLVAYRALDPSNSGHQAQIRELYIEFANIQNDIAVQLGYSNYMEYAYASVYGRDYTYEEVSAMTDMVFSEVLSYAGMAIEKFKSDGNYLFENYPKVYSEFSSINSGWTIRSSKGKKILNNFFTALGEEPNGYWTDLMNGGNYFIASNSNAYAGAFSTFLYDVNEPMVYFGPGYQSLSTTVHEFGHYMAFIRGRDGADNYDLAETHSQGMEMLLMQFLYQDQTKEAVDYHITYEILNGMITLLNSFAINAFETYVYTHLDTITASQLDAIYQEILNSIPYYADLNSLVGGALNNYWYYVTVESPGYYISYGISLIASLEILAIASEDFDAAVEIYMALGEADTPMFCDELVEAGLYTPFDANTYAILGDFLSEILVPIDIDVSDVPLS